MPKVHNPTARSNIYRDGIRVPDPKTKRGYRIDRSKPNPEGDHLLVEKGERYYRWKLYNGPLQISISPPKRSQLTGSEFLGTVWDIEDDELSSFAGDPEDLEEIVERLTELRDECEEKRDNMPEGLYDSPTGELLGERYDYLEEMIGEIEDKKSEFSDILESIREITYNGE